MNSEKIPLCNSTGLQTMCCAHLSAGPQSLSQEYGIEKASVHGDRLSDNIMASYMFQGESINCSKFLDSYTRHQCFSVSDYFCVINQV